MFSAKTNKTSIRTMRSMCFFAAFVISIAPLSKRAVAEETEFEVAELFFELNDTDGDLGIHAMVDGEPWKELEIQNSQGDELLEVEVDGRLKKQGLTEIFFESAEPSFEDLAPEDFFLRFEEGTYLIEGKPLKGKTLQNYVDLTHVMPAPAGGIEISNKWVDLGEVTCGDEDEEGEGVPRFERGTPITISWDPVDSSHRDIGREGEVIILNYEVVLEVEIEIDEDYEFTSYFSVYLPPDVRSVEIPKDFLELGDEFKYEILAREESFNQTAVESCFVFE